MGAGVGDGGIVLDGALSCVDTAGLSGVSDVDDVAGDKFGEAGDCASCVDSTSDNVLI